MIIKIHKSFSLPEGGQLLISIAVQVQLADYLERIAAQLTGQISEPTSEIDASHLRIFTNLSLRPAVRNGHRLNHPGLLADLQRLLKVSTGTRREMLMYFAVSFGLRHSELLGLQWGDLDRERAGIQVQRSVGLNKIGAMCVGPLKTTSNRMAYLDDHHFVSLE